MTPQEAWAHLDRQTRQQPHSRHQAFGHQQLVELTSQLDADGRADIEDALLVLARSGNAEQKRFAAGYWGVVAPSSRIFAQVVDLYLAAPTRELGGVLGQVLGLPWSETELDRLQAHFLDAPAHTPELLFNLITARPHEPSLWRALVELTQATDEYAKLCDLYGTAAAIGRGADLLPLLHGKPETVLRRVASGLWGADKQRFIDGLGLA